MMGKNMGSAAANNLLTTSLFSYIRSYQYYGMSLASVDSLATVQVASTAFS